MIYETLSREDINNSENELEVSDPILDSTDGVW